MSGCGYVCPLCEGSGLDEGGNPCSYCSAEQPEGISVEQWIAIVHENSGCSD